MLCSKWDLIVINNSRTEACDGTAISFKTSVAGDSYQSV